MNDKNKKKSHCQSVVNMGVDSAPINTTSKS